MLGLLFALAPSAHGARAEYSEVSQYRSSYTLLAYSASSGEANDLTVSHRDGTYTFVDSGATIEPGRSCVARTAHEVACVPPSRISYLRVNVGDGDDRTVVDPVAPIGEAESYFSFNLSGGPGNDRLDITAARGRSSGVHGDDGDDLLLGGSGQADFSRLYGGAGADEIIGGPGRSDLHGDSGNDVLRAATGGSSVNGGGGFDRLLGGPGDDYLADTDGTYSYGAGTTAVDADIIDGAAGNDTVSYYERFGGVWVDLSDSDRDGEPGEFDALTNLENVAGGFGDDTLIGDGGPNVLEGREGEDTLHGQAGNDIVRGESGFDRMFAGPGADRIDAGETYVSPMVDYRHIPGLGERVVCGSGRDRVGAIDPDYESPGLEAADELAPDCEKVTLIQPTPSDEFYTPAAVRLDVQPIAEGSDPRTVSVRVTCLRVPKPFSACRGELRLAGRQRDRARRDLVSTGQLGESAFDLRVGHRTVVRVPLNRRGRELLLRSRVPPVQVQVRRFLSKFPRKLSRPFAYTSTIAHATRSLGSR